MTCSTRLGVMVLAISAVACGAPAVPPAAAPPPPPPPAVTSPSPPSPPPPVTAVTSPPKPAPPPAPTEVDRILAAVPARLTAKDWPGAQQAIDRARAAMGTDPDERFKVDYQQATLQAYRGDLEAAAKVLVTFLVETPDRPGSDIEFRIHNTLMMIRGGQGDLLAAMAENDACTVLGLHQTWSTGDEAVPREKYTWMKDTWHRAYYYRMWAEKVTGSRRDAALRYAEAGRKAYTDLARTLPSYQDSIAVLDGLFATLAGEKDKALAAGKKVNVKGDDDVEDLYLVAISLEAGGDKAGADAVKKQIRESAPYLAVPIITKFLDADEGKGKARFSPRHPSGAP